MKPPEILTEFYLGNTTQAHKFAQAMQLHCHCSIFAHPLLVTQLQALTDQVASLQAKDPQVDPRSKMLDSAHPPGDWDALLAQVHTLPKT